MKGDFSVGSYTAKATSPRKPMRGKGMPRLEVEFDGSEVSRGRAMLTQVK